MSLIGRRSIRLKNEVQFVNSYQKLYYSSPQQAFCFHIEDSSGVTKICIGKDGITSTDPVNVCIINTQPIDVNLASETIGITTTQTILVDTGLTELGISSFPVANVNVDIVAQTLSELQVSSGSTDVASEETLQEISNSLSAYNGTNPLEEKLYSQPNCIYQSNYKGMFSSRNQLYFEHEIGTGAYDYNHTSFGLTVFDLLAGRDYKRITTFFPYRGGKTLYVYTLSNADFPNTETTEIVYEMGLEEIGGNNVRIQANCLNTTGTSGGSIDIYVTMTAQDSSTVTKSFIGASNFNIDIIDGTGPSGFTYDPEWSNQKFFILTDDNLHYTFGLINGFNLIPIHSFSQNDVVGSLTEGSRLAAHRPYWKVITNQADSERSMDIHGFSIYKDSEISYKSSHTITGSNTNIDGTTNGVLFLALRYRDIARYRGNIQPISLNVESDRVRRIFIYYGSPATPVSIVGASWTSLGNIEYDTSGTSFTSSGATYSFQINSGNTSISLEDIIDWKFFGYNYDASDRTIVLLAAENLGAGTGNFLWDFVFKQF